MSSEIKEDLEDQSQQKSATQSPTLSPEQDSEKAQSIIAETKQTYRKKVWEHLEANKLVIFPRPCFGRIPNYKGADQAAARIADLEEFKLAQAVEVNPDKAVEHPRSLVLEHDKTLYVPIPRLQEGLLKKLTTSKTNKNIRSLVTRKGLETHGEFVDFAEKLNIDLIVVGSVAVDVSGRRIGKGKGYADLEYAILKEMKAVDDDTVIVTAVHDSQVFDNLPHEIFTKCDVPVDYIVTPTRTIKVERKLSRPEGIYWNLLTQRQLYHMPILKKIREFHDSEGRDTTLRETDPTADLEGKGKSPRTFRRRSRNAPVNQSSNIADSKDPQKPRAGRSRRRPKSAVKDDNGLAAEHPEGESQRRRRPFRRSGRRIQFDFSLMVGNIEKSVRVRQLKDALTDRGIKPNDITWRGYKGFCYLHYAKPVQKDTDKKDEEEDEAFGVDNVIEILQTLKLNPDSTANLSVKVMEPITRIETTDVTAV